MEHDNLPGGPRWRPLVDDLEVLLRAVAKGSPRVRTLKAGLVYRLKELDARMTKERANDRDSWLRGDANRRLFVQAAMACEAAGQKVTVANIKKYWPLTLKLPESSHLYELYDWWWIWKPADPGVAES